MRLVEVERQLGELKSVLVTVKDRLGREGSMRVLVDAVRVCSGSGVCVCVTLKKSLRIPSRTWLVY